MRVHVDWPWSTDVRRYGAPMRIHLHLKKGMLLVGLFPWVKAQRRDPDGYYRDNYRWITWHPDAL